MTLFPYDSIYEYVKTFKKDKKVLLCKKKVNSRLVSNIPADTRILDEENLTLLPKATKNPVEVEMNALRISETELQLQSSYTG